MKLSLICLACGVVCLTACDDKLKDSFDNTPKPLVAASSPQAFAVVSDFKGANTGQIIVPKPTAEQDKLIKQALDNTNKVRAEQGLPALKYNPNLSAYAQVRAGELAVLFDHKRPNGQSYANDLVVIGATGENIAAGNATADETVLGQWKNSAGHYRNMTNSTYTSIGIGVVYVPNSKYGYYWVQIFGTDNTKSRYSFDQETVHNAKPLDSIVTNGAVVPLSVRAGNWQVLQGSGYLGWANGYDASRFGAIKFDNQDTQVFYQGLRTDSQAMPNAGRANYQGQAVIVKNNQMSTNGEVAAVVDFGAKQISGAIGHNGQTLLNFAGDVQGSGFASHLGGTQVQGAFFGANAGELAGVFQDDKTATKGAFGAVKR